MSMINDNNTDDRIDMTATIDRRLAALRADAEKFKNPIMPAVVNRPAPRARRNSVRHRAIR